MNAIELKNVSKRIGKEFCLSNISFSLEEGMVLAIVGFYKSNINVLFEAMTGMTSIDRGEIFIGGKKFTEDSKNDLGIVLNRNSGAFDIFNVEELNMLMKISFKNWKSNVFYDYIKKFDIPNDKPYYKFTSRERKKFDIAIALSHDAKLLILDEIYVNEETCSEILDILNEFRENNHSIVFVTSNLKNFSRICDYIAIVDNGRLSVFEEIDVLTNKYCHIITTSEKLEEMDKSAILYRSLTGKQSEIEAIVERRKIPKDLNIETEPVSIDELALYLT